MPRRRGGPEEEFGPVPSRPVEEVRLGSEGGVWTVQSPSPAGRLPQVSVCHDLSLGYDESVGISVIHIIVCPWATTL